MKENNNYHNQKNQNDSKDLPESINVKTKLVINQRQLIYICFGLMLIISFIIRLACFTGLIASDDLGYSHYAQLIASGKYIPELHHYAIRYGLLVPVSIIYRIFGVSEWTTIILPLFLSTLSVSLLMAISLRLSSNLRVALISGILFATFPLQLRFATILVPETIAEFYVLIGILIYLHPKTRKSLLLGMASGFFLGIAYLTKELALFITFALILDAVIKRQWRQSFYVGFGLAIVLILENTYYLAMSGDLMFRQHAMIHHNLSPSAIEANQDIYYRLLKSYPRKLFIPNIDFGLHSIFCFILLIPALLKLKANKQKAVLLSLWLLFPGLYLNFGTSNLSHYFVLPAYSRYMELVFPPLFILSAIFLERHIFKRKITAYILILVIVVVAVAGIYCGFTTRGRGWRTDEVAMLRIIARDVKENQLYNLKIEHKDPKTDEIWKDTLIILNGQPDNGKTDMSIQPDCLGLPSALQVQPHVGQ